MEKTRGIIHKAPVSLTVAAICKASAPKEEPAPTTELVSWIAAAARKPNCRWDSPRKWPTGGKINKTSAFNTRIVPKAAEISLVFAFTAGAAAMALPPHIAVSAEI